jgi:hypothetical protein
LTWPLGTEVECLDILVGRAQRAGYTSVDRNNLKNADIVFIIDEGQMSYSDTDLWLGFVKYQHGRLSGPKFCVLSSYGSPSAGPSDHSVCGSPFAYLGPQQRMSIIVSKIKDSPQICLFYNRKEFNDVVQRFCGVSTRPLPLRSDAADYIFDLTNGHPGAVDGVLKMIQKVLSAICFCATSR